MIQVVQLLFSARTYISINGSTYQGNGHGAKQRTLDEGLCYSAVYIITKCRTQLCVYSFTRSTMLLLLYIPVLNYSLTNVFSVEIFPCFGTLSADILLSSHHYTLKSAKQTNTKSNTRDSSFEVTQSRTAIATYLRERPTGKGAARGNRARASVWSEGAAPGNGGKVSDRGNGAKERLI